jgi:hypothetical protein
MVDWGTTETDSEGNVCWANESVVSFPVDTMILGIPDARDFIRL